MVLIKSHADQAYKNWVIAIAYKSVSGKKIFILEEAWF